MSISRMGNKHMFHVPNNDTKNVTIQTSKGPKRGSLEGYYHVKGNNGVIAHCHLGYGSLLFMEFH